MRGKIAHSGLPQFFRTTGEEILFSHGERSLVFDLAGTSYIDFVLGFGPVILGHAHPAFQERLINYLGNGIHLPGYTRWHDEYLDKLLGQYRKEYSASFFKTASEAVSAALRICALLTGKMGIIRCGYIGWHDALIAKSVQWHEPPGSALREQTRFMSGFRGIGSEEPVFNWINFDLEEFQALLEHEGHRIGAFVIDAYQLSFADVLTIEQAIALCHASGLLVVFDETKTAGRVSRLGLAIDKELNVDFLILGKSLANGAPLSILVAKHDILAYAGQARISGTFSKELLGVYCALATHDIMEELSGFDVISSLGLSVTENFNLAAREAGVIDLVKAVSIFGGGMFDLRFSDGIVVDKNLRQQLPRYLADNKILLLEGHPSYVCIDHNLLDWDDFHQQLTLGLEAWGRWCRANLKVG